MTRAKAWATCDARTCAARKAPANRSSPVPGHRQPRRAPAHPVVADVRVQQLLAAGARPRPAVPRRGHPGVHRRLPQLPLARRQGPDRVAGRTGRSQAAGWIFTAGSRQPQRIPGEWRPLPPRRTKSPASAGLLHASSTQPARPGACAAEAWSSRPCGLTITVQVIPAESSTPSGTSSMYPHRHALGQAHPVESGVDVGGQLAAFRVVAVVDTAGAFHVAP